MSIKAAVAAPLSESDANDFIAEYQSNPIADFGEHSSFLLEKAELEDFFPGSTHYHIFLGREGGKMRIIVAGVKEDATHEYKKVGISSCVLQHIEACSVTTPCRISTSPDAINETSL